MEFSSIALVGSAAIISFALGLLYKKVLVVKQRKRILNLEDEMLSNHSTILKLEKEISDLRKGLAGDYHLSQTKHPDQGLKAS